MCKRNFAILQENFRPCPSGPEEGGEALPASPVSSGDIHNFLAEMALAEADKATALKHAGIAKERAWCNGPPHCYRKALDQAEQMLAKLQ